MNGNPNRGSSPAAQDGGESAAEDGFDGFSPRNPVKTVIVGSTGRMGAMLLARAQAAGLNVTGVDVPLTPQTLAPACAGADLAIICVPAAVFSTVIATVCPHLAPTAVLADITSVKEIPLRQMEEAWAGPVVGTHPLFGPKPDADDQPVAIVPGAQAAQPHIELTAGFFTALGCRVFRTSAQKHDKAMFAGLFEANPYSYEAVRQYRQMLNLAAAGDIDLLCQRARWWWQDEADQQKP